MAIETSIIRRDEHGHPHHAKLVLDGEEADRYEEDRASHMLTNQPTSGTYTGTIDGIAATELVTFDVKVTFPES